MTMQSLYNVVKLSGTSPQMSPTARYGEKQFMSIEGTAAGGGGVADVIVLTDVSERREGTDVTAATQLKRVPDHSQSHCVLIEVSGYRQKDAGGRFHRHDINSNAVLQIKVGMHF